MKRKIISLTLLLAILCAFLPQLSLSATALEAETASFISRSDGVWLWPLSQSAYNSFSDWAGCNGNSSCKFHSGNNHGGCSAASHATSDGNGHNGIDVGVVAGTSVYAAADGTLYCTSTNWESRGITAVVEHPAGTDTNGTSWSYYSIYQHLQSVVSSSDQKTVSAGDTIAYSGNTGGSASYAAHLHFGIVLAKSGLGYSMSRDPNSVLSGIEGEGWIQTSGFQKGRILNNPALNSPAGYPTGNSAVVPNLKSHAGSVMYTFDKSEVTIGGTYLSKCTSYPAHCKIKANANTNAMSLPCSSGTDSTSTVVESVSSGATMTATELILNSAGNYWYKVTTSDGKTAYVPASKMDYISSITSDVTISDANAPTNLSVGEKFSIKGTIQATYNDLINVSAYVYSGFGRADATVTGGSATVSGKSYTLLNSEVDRKVLFNQLPAGNYTYAVYATCKNYYAVDEKTSASNTKEIGLHSAYFTVTDSSVSTYVVTFDANGGNCSVSTATVATGNPIGTLPTPTRDGYTFSGWFTSASGGTQVTASTIVTSNLTVYAHWTEKPKTVTLYDASGSVWKTGSCAAGSAYTLPDTYPTKSGSYFSGWSYQQNAEVFDIRPGDSIDIPADVSLYPVYVTHAQAITGEPVLIYNIADFTEDGYTISEEVYELTREVDASYWTDWSAYSTTAVKASDTVEVKTTAMYRYYYYLCPGCGDHNPLAGGCGCGSSSYDWHETWSTIAYSKSNYSTVSYATSKCSTTSLGDGQLWYFSAGNKNDTAIGTSDSDSSSTVIATGYSSRSYVAKTETKTQMVVAYQLTAVTVSSLEISSMPSKTTYEVGESLDTTGLSVKVTYSDGSTKTLDSGYTVSGFDSTSAGKKTVTVSYKGKNTTFIVTVNKTETVEPSDAQFVFESKSVSSGQTITVEITAANVPAISSLMLENFQYDSDILEFVSAELHLNATISEWDPADMSAVAAFSGNTDINGLVMTMTFQVKEGAEGDSTITCNAIAYEIPESGGQTAVNLKVVPGTITALAYERGDVNGDGYVNSNDAIYLLRYTLSPSRYPINQNGDMNGDGYVNSNDAIYLLRYTLSPSRYPLS